MVYEGTNYNINVEVLTFLLESKTSVTKSPVKKAGPKGPASQRKPKARRSSEAALATQIEERKCPLEKCDSLGHLGGQHDKHFTIEACPMFHNLTSQQCKVSEKKCEPK